MRTRKSERGSAATAALLALLQVILVAVTVYVFAAKLYSPPPPISEVGRAVDEQYKLTLWVTAIVFVLSQAGLAYAVWRFRDHGQRSHFSRGNNTMEFVWTTATIVLFLGLGILGRKAWAEVRFAPPASDAVQVEVTENQFVFNFRYPGPDGKFGRLDPKQISASTGNPLGIDAKDPAGKDDIVVPTLTVPVNRQVELHVTSQDVIHNFFVRELRLQPGQNELQLPLTWTDGHGVTVTKTLSFHRAQYEIGVAYQVANASAMSWSFAPYAQVLRYNVPVERSYFRPERHVREWNDHPEPCHQLIRPSLRLVPGE